MTVPNGGYYVFTNPPGTLSFTTRVKINPLNFGLVSLLSTDQLVLMLDVKPDTTYYLKLFDGALKELSPENGKVALGKCKKIIISPPSISGTNNLDAPQRASSATNPSVSPGEPHS